MSIFSKLFFSLDLDLYLFLKSLLPFSNLFCLIGAVLAILLLVVASSLENLHCLITRGWKELLGLMKKMSSSKQPLPGMEELMEKTRNLSWEDVSGLLKMNNERARDFKALTLVGRLAASKIFPKPIIFPLIKADWRFAPNLRIEYVGPNKFLFSFQSLEEKERILRIAPLEF